ncbi:MAG: hypothetical protein KGZ50_09490 [Peptococcaceae bacterium]|nr:hypothetical protein [Peptococcaceae bacterium]
MMTIVENEEKLFEEWKLKRPGLIKDGVVNEETFSKSKIKILYLLKEVNGGVDWDLRKFISEGARTQTWDNIARWTYGIQNLGKEVAWSEISSFLLEWRKEQISSICAVNLKKISGGHTTVANKLYAIAIEDKDLLKKQLELYGADVIICCGSSVGDLYTNYLYKEENQQWRTTTRGVRYCTKGDSRFVIQYAHPEARVNDSLLYYGLIDAVKEIYGGGSPVQQYPVQ